MSSIIRFLLSASSTSAAERITRRVARSKAPDEFLAYTKIGKLFTDPEDQKVKALCAAESSPREVFHKLSPSTNITTKARLLSCACFDLKRWLENFGINNVLEMPASQAVSRFEPFTPQLDVEILESLGFSPSDSPAVYGAVNLLEYGKVLFPKISKENDQKNVVIFLEKSPSQQYSEKVLVVPNLGREFSELSLDCFFTDLTAIFVVKLHLHRTVVSGEVIEGSIHLANHCVWMALSKCLYGSPFHPLKVKDEVLPYLISQWKIFSDDDIAQRHRFWMSKSPKEYQIYGEGKKKEEFVKNYYEIFLKPKSIGLPPYDIQKIVYYFRIRKNNPVHIRLFMQEDDYGDHLVMYEHPPVAEGLKAHGDLLCFSAHCNAVDGVPNWISGNYIYPAMLENGERVKGVYELPAKVCTAEDLQGVTKEERMGGLTLNFNYNGAEKSFSFKPMWMSSFYLACVSSFLFGLDINGINLTRDVQKTVIPKLTIFRVLNDSKVYVADKTAEEKGPAKANLTPPVALPTGNEERIECPNCSGKISFKVTGCYIAVFCGEKKKRRYKWDNETKEKYRKRGLVTPCQVFCSARNVERVCR